MVVAVDQHRDDGGDRARAFDAGAGALEQLRQVGEDRGRIAARDRRLAGSGRHLAQRVGEAGDRIQHQQHAVALVAKMLGDAHGGVGRAPAHHGALVAGGDDGDGLGHAVVADRVLEEFAHLAAALADQRDDDGVEGVGAGEHGEQRRLADAGAGEDAEALAEAERREDVDDAHAGHEGGADALARQGAGRRGVAGGRGSRPAISGGPPSIGRVERVDGAAAPGGVRRHGERTPAKHGIADAGVGAAFEGRDDDLVAADLDDLAAARAGLAAVLDDVAEPGDSGKAAHLVVRRRDLGDAAATLDQPHRRRRSAARPAPARPAGLSGAGWQLAVRVRGCEDWPERHATTSSRAS